MKCQHINIIYGGKLEENFKRILVFFFAINVIDQSDSNS